MLYPDKRYRVINNARPYIVPVQVGCYVCNTFTTSPLRLEDGFGTAVCSPECRQEAYLLPELRDDPGEANENAPTREESKPELQFENYPPLDNGLAGRA